MFPLAEVQDGIYNKKSNPPYLGQVGEHRVFSAKWAFSICDFLFCVPVPKIYKKGLTSLFAAVFLDISSTRRTHSYNNLYDIQNLLKKHIFIVFDDQMIKIKTPEFKAWPRPQNWGHAVLELQPKLCLNPMFFLLDSVVLFKATYGIDSSSQEITFQ